MSLSDIILKIFKEHGSLSSRQVLEILRQNQQKYGIKRLPSLRTIQRHISNFLRQGILKPEPPIGREQKYSLATEQEKTSLQAYLTRQFRKELEEVKTEYLYGNISRAYRKAKLLALSLPEPYKQQLKPTIEEIDKKLEKIKREIEQTASQPYQIVSPLNLVIRHSQEEYLAETAIPKLIEKINEQLYKMQEEIGHE